MSKTKLHVSCEALMVPTGMFKCPAGNSVVGVHIAELPLLSADPKVRLFVDCDGDGASAWLNAAQAREMALKLETLATMLEAGATGSVVQ